MSVSRSEVAATAGVSDRIRALVAAGEALRARPIEEILEVVAEACRRWRGPGPDREAGEEALAVHYAVPRRPIAEILDTAFSSWTLESLRDWIAGELGDPTVLDGFARSGGLERRAFGPRLAVFLAARGVPTTPIADIVSALCVKSPAWLKPPSGGDDLAGRFARTLAEVDPGIGNSVVVEGWERGSRDGERVLASADAVIATGGAETMTAIQRKISPHTRLVLHGPRMSAAIVLREPLGSESRATIDALARDTAFAGQMGCLSPVVAYVEGSLTEVADLVEPVHAACVERWPGAPRAQTSLAERVAFAEWRGTAGLEAGVGRVSWTGDVDSAWTIVARREAGPPEPPPVPRMLTLLPVGDVMEAVEFFPGLRGKVATVGTTGPKERIADLAGPLAEAGVERVCALGRMQSPPAAWRRDGRATLTDLARWMDQEQPS
ncbi:MAG TPA: acyl-CoA reductase [Gemmatimonadota bacterium]|nr:acyl-CoA reductase [Gemmatimonadota bacterium]